MRGLDNYIMGTHQTHTEDIPHKCSKCRATKDVPMLFNMGGWFYLDDDDAFCCEQEMEIVEEE